MSGVLLALLELRLPLLRALLGLSGFLALGFLLDARSLGKPLVALLSFTLLSLLALHLLLELRHGLLAAFLLPEETVFGDFELTALAEVASRVLEVLEHVVNEARCVDFAELRVVELGSRQLVQAVVVEDLDELREDGSLVEHALDRHLDLKLV